MSEETRRIEELTPEMEARIPVVRDQWIKIGLSTEPADRPRAEEGIRKAYKAANLDPEAIHTLAWVDSPLAGVTLAAQWVKAGGIPEEGDPPLPDVTNEEIREQLNNCCYGQHSAGWLSFYDFFNPYLPDIIAPLEGQMEVAKSAHWWWPFEYACIICDRPEVLKRDDEGRLHCEDGPAVKYRDGYSVYAWHGTRIPGWIVEEPEKLDKTNIFGEENQEIRRAMIEKYGFAKFLEDAGAKLIQEDNRGKLVSITGIDGNDDESLFVIVTDSTHPDQKYALGVPPETKTAAEGVAKSFGFEKPEDYNPDQET